MRVIRQNLCLLLLGGLPLGLAFILLIYPASRNWPALIIYDSDPVPQEADAIVVLMGSVKERSQQAAQLWKKGYAPYIVFVEADTASAIPGIRPSDGEATYRYLQQLGVPQNALIFSPERDVTSTFEEATAVYASIRQKLPDAKNLILCTSWYHSSRAEWIFERSNNDPYQFYLSSMPPPPPEYWYQEERDFLNVFNEYLKWAFYLLHY